MTPVGQAYLSYEGTTMNWSCGLQFRVRTGPDRGATYPIDTPVLKIGRARQPGDRQSGWLRLHDDTVSRLHCELFWQEDRQSLRLLHRSATNSTYVNGEAVEDIELFDGDLLELGHVTLEVQRADLRWSPSKTTPPSQVESDPEAPPCLPSELTKTAWAPRIPGATVAPTASVSQPKITIGPRATYHLISGDGEAFVLATSRIRFGSAEDPALETQKEPAKSEVPPQDPTPAQIQPSKAKLHFDTHYILTDTENQGRFSFYNLILRYDELYQGYKAARVGPKAQEISISRQQGGLLWHSSFPEGVEVELIPGDQLLLGNIPLTYHKVMES